MKVAIIGRTQILYETALKLLTEGHKIACIITAKAAPEYTRNENDFKDLAKHINAPYFLTQTLDNPQLQEACQGLDIGVSINWVSVIKQSHVDLFRLGILNSHHGDLPKYRGNACSNWAIINGEEKITNSIHFMEGGKLDCGNIVCQEHFSLNGDKTITDVYKWSEESTPTLFAQALKELSVNPDFTIKYASPDSHLAFRCYPRLPEDSYINWDRPVHNIHNLIRAVCFPFSGAYTYHRYKGKVKKLFILKSRIIQSETNDYAAPGHILENNIKTGESFVQCGNGIIALLKCRYDGEQEEFAPGERWRSIRMRLGVRIDDWLWEMSKQHKA
jgi:methionyl-tRNA formyltransferase